MNNRVSIILATIVVAITNMACQIGEDSIFLISEGYQGNITIFLERPYGEPMRYEDGSRVFEIPSSGVLFSQFGKTSRFADYKVFYVSKNGKRREVPNIGLAEVDHTVSIDHEAVYIYRAGYGSIVLNDGQTLKNVPGYKPGDTVKTIGFVLSSPQNWDSIAALMLKQHGRFFEFSTYNSNE